LTNKTRDTERREKMTQLTDEHFELHTKNKAEQHERQKIKFLEDRIKTLENAIESHAKILARFQMTEGEYDRGENNHE
jgi:TolA-binding protein